MDNILIGMGSLMAGGFAWLLYRNRQSVNVMPVETPAVSSGNISAPTKKRLTPTEVWGFANKVVTRHFPRVDRNMLVAMAQIESSLNPTAKRYEPHINTYSYGLMQTLLTTADWLYRDMGATAYGRPTEKSLKDPETSMYFAAAYVKWLMNYRGQQRSEEWIVRAYNGGPSWEQRTGSISMTLNHWNKYKKTRYG
ncbi:MAG: transglycosylase SLT domain-containing protein [Alphaproteobacteria bacterium]|nr:transglycosylase SLT domain-containing protein [Alphaproteobacteria bacterium]MDD9919005.1 transglycosylase SLT domain-containing protein [Alphaproteobacteria bacterium]